MASPSMDDLDIDDAFDESEKKELSDDEEDSVLLLWLKFNVCWSRGYFY